MMPVHTVASEGPSANIAPGVNTGAGRGVSTLHSHWSLIRYTNDRALFARFARSNLNFQEPGNEDTKLSGKGRGEDTCYMSHVILAKLET